MLTPIENRRQQLVIKLAYLIQHLFSLLIRRIVLSEKEKNCGRIQQKNKVKVSTWNPEQIKFTICRRYKVKKNKIKSCANEAPKENLREETHQKERE